MNENKIKYSVVFIPKAEFRNIHNEDEIKELVKLEIIRNNNSITIGSNYLEDESYYIKINLKDLSYTKSYKIKAGEKWVIKKDLPIKEELELKRIKEWIYTKLLGVVYSGYRKVKDNEVSLSTVKKDLENILERLS